MHTDRVPPCIGLRLTDDGPTMGTVQQFADRLGLSPSRIRTCLRRHDALVAQAGEGVTQLLVVRARGITALLRCAARDPDPCSSQRPSP
jgi:hypothetical protein